MKVADRACFVSSRVSRGVAAFLAAVIVFGAAQGCAKKPKPEVSLSTCLSELTNTMAFCETPAGKQHLLSTYDRTGGNSDWRSFQRHEEWTAST
jgi:hypothetical protein